MVSGRINAIRSKYQGKISTMVYFHFKSSFLIMIIIWNFKFEQSLNGWWCMSHEACGELSVLTSIIQLFFRQNMYMDSSLATYTENDGILTLMHCQERNFQLFYVLNTRYEWYHMINIIWDFSFFRFYCSWSLNPGNVTDIEVLSLTINSIKSWNVRWLPNVFHTHLSNQNWIASSILVPKKARNTLLESRLVSRN